MKAEEPRTVLFTGGRQTGRTQLAIQQAYQLGLQEGRKEVVEWIRATNHSGDFYYSFDQAEFANKLKDWEVK